MTLSQRTTFTPIADRDPSSVRAVILARLSDEAGKDSPIESQIAACRQFVARWGWRLVAEPFSEKKSGYHHVRRAALAEVEALIAERAVDVVVLTDFERLARTEERRYAALFHARRYGAEYRFVALGGDGKLDASPTAKLYGSVMQVFGEIERDKIFARTMRGRMHRAARGVPNGGRGGPAFGYQFVGEKPYQTWARRDDEAALLLWMAETLVSDERATARHIARDLNARGVTTREGYRWSGQTVSQKLRNPLYAGRGRLLRWQTEWQQVSDAETGETFDQRIRVRREADETLPIATNAVPILIPPELFDAVQRKLDANRTHPRGGAPREPLPDGFTLLHHGLIVCARCGFPMARHRRTLAKGTVGYYMCSARLRSPEHDCPVHSIHAPAVDDLVLRAVAAALVDPERTVALANAASERLARAETDLAVVESHLDATRARLSDLDADRARYVKILNLLDTTKDAETLAEYRAKLTALDAERTKLVARADAMTPQRARAEAGVEMLVALREGRMLARVEHDGRVYDVASITRADLFAMIGGSLEQIAQFAHEGRDYARETGDDLDAAVFDEWFHHVPMKQADLAYTLLRDFMPPQELRRLLRRLDVQVRVRPPRTPEERAERGYFTPFQERLTVALGDLILWDGTQSEVNGSTLMTISMIAPLASPPAET
jgi:DNA invertase Pin-like site-specific DNA recombinase